jgi:hypothetical protein
MAGSDCCWSFFWVYMGIYGFFNIRIPGWGFARIWVVADESRIPRLDSSEKLAISLRNLRHLIEIAVKGRSLV